MKNTTYTYLGTNCWIYSLSLVTSDSVFHNIIKKKYEQRNSK